MKQRLSIFLLLISIPLLLMACSFSVSSFSENLNKVVRANNDPQTVLQALPAYLVLLDALIESDPEDEALLIASSRLMNAYGALLATQQELMSVELEGEQYNYQRNIISRQQKKLSEKALSRAAKAICLYDDNLCNLTTIQYAEFVARLQSVDEDDIDMLYSLGISWASWLQVNSDDWNALAQLPQIKLIMQTVISKDETWDNAGAHMYLGVLNSLLPATLGGKPEQGKMHFEAAIRLTDGKNLMAKVLYAEYYARLTFNSELHKQLVADVLASSETQHEFILLNTLAIQKARALQISAEDYF